VTINNQDQSDVKDQFLKDDVLASGLTTITAEFIETAKDIKIRNTLKALSDTIQCDDALDCYNDGVCDTLFVCNCDNANGVGDHCEYSSEVSSALTGPSEDLLSSGDYTTDLTEFRSLAYMYPMLSVTDRTQLRTDWESLTTSTLSTTRSLVKTSTLFQIGGLIRATPSTELYSKILKLMTDNTYKAFNFYWGGKALLGKLSLQASSD